MKQNLSRVIILALNFTAQATTFIPVSEVKIIQFINAQPKSDPSNLPNSAKLFPGVNREKMLWSILIPTLTERRECFKTIFTKLLRQIEAAQLQEHVEIVFYRDNCDEPVGFKRNQLLAGASGKYTCFVDDDDDIHDEYITMIYEKLLEDKDCVKLVGIYNFDNKWQKVFIHSLSYRSYFEKNHVYYRPPNHLNPIRHSIAIQFKFPDAKNFGEDTDWAMQICNSGILQSEASCDEPYYYYNFSPQKSVSNRRIQDPEKAKQLALQKELRDKALALITKSRQRQ